jgi:hypothetical protein
MTLSSQEPKLQISSDDYGSRRARHYGLRAVARALGLRDFVALPRTRRQLNRKARGLKVRPSRPSRA